MGFSKPEMSLSQTYLTCICSLIWIIQSWANSKTPIPTAHILAMAGTVAQIFNECQAFKETWTGAWKLIPVTMRILQTTIR